MTRLQWFEAGYGTTGVELGIISPDVFIKYIRYRVYQDFRSKKHDHGTAMELAAEQCKCAAWTIWSAINFMQGKEDKAARSEHGRRAARVKWDRIKDAPLLKVKK